MPVVEVEGEHPLDAAVDENAGDADVDAEAGLDGGVHDQLVDVGALAGGSRAVADVEAVENLLGVVVPVGGKALEAERIKPEPELGVQHDPAGQAHRQRPEDVERPLEGRADVESGSDVGHEIDGLAEEQADDRHGVVQDGELEARLTGAEVVRVLELLE